MSRACDAIACTHPVAPGRFMCLKHWKLVPLTTQRTINARYRVGRANFAFLRDPLYLQAAVDAIDGIASIERVEGANPYRRHLLIVQRQSANSGANK